MDLIEKNMTKCMIRLRIFAIASKNWSKGLQGVRNQASRVVYLLSRLEIFSNTDAKMISLSVNCHF